MSFRKEQLYQKQQFHQTNEQQGYINLSAYATAEELSTVVKETLSKGMHGLCFSLYEDGQKPGDTIGEEQIRRRMAIIAPYTKWVRSFSCIEGNELIPKIAKEFNMKTLVGAWLGNDKDKNKLEIEGLLKLAQEGLVDIAAVGNEVLYRKDLSEEELINYIEYVKEKIPHIPVGYVDAYYEFAIKPRITHACDVILTNCYPYWEGTPIEYALIHMKNMYYQTVNAAQGKPVIITETGWPSMGESLRGAVPSLLHFVKYFMDTQVWAKEENVEVFYFSSFDESWKVGAEGIVGAYWGIWDKHEQLKF
jgi:glucan 1,3-beta-glucosidase